MLILAPLPTVYMPGITSSLTTDLLFENGIEILF
jgi:hypothetical protein